MAMRSLLIVFLLVFLIPLTVNAMVISVQVQDVLNGRSSYLEFNKTSFVELDLDWENTGSLDCSAQLEAEMTDPLGKTRRMWSQKEALAPGDSALLRLYYMPPQSGGYRADLNLHYCDKVIPLKTFRFDFERPAMEELNVSETATTTESTIRFELEPGSDMKYIKIIPLDVPKTWIFEPASAENLAGGNKTSLVMRYEPVFWMPRNATFALVSDKGYKEVTVELRQADTTPWLNIILLSLLVISVVLNMVLYSRTRGGGRSDGNGEEKIVKHKSGE